MSTINLQYTTFTTPLPDFIFENLKSYSANANGYRPQPADLIEKLAKKHSLPKENIYLTAGSDEAIQMFALAYGKATYFFTPTYNVYAGTTDFFANIHQISALKDSQYIISTDTIPDATLIFLANPNNPCGFTPKEKVIELVKNNPQAIVFIDEVYAEFADLSVIDQVLNYPNLAVIRSFSKSYGMAGNRIAYVSAQKDIIDVIKLKSQWANVSYLSAGAAMSALDHEEYFQELRSGVIERREDITQFLTARHFTLIPTSINCVLISFESEQKGTEFAKHLVAHDFVISHGNGNSNVGLDLSYVRISIGSQDEITVLKDTIEKFLR